MYSSTCSSHKIIILIIYNYNLGYICILYNNSCISCYRLSRLFLNFWFNFRIQDNRPLSDVRLQWASSADKWLLLPSSSSSSSSVSRSVAVHDQQRDVPPMYDDDQLRRSEVAPLVDQVKATSSAWSLPLLPWSWWRYSSVEKSPRRSAHNDMISLNLCDLVELLHVDRPRCSSDADLTECSAYTISALSLHIANISYIIMRDCKFSPKWIGTGYLT